MRLRTRYTQRLPVAPGLRLDIPMFEGSGTKVLDVSGKGNHGTIHNAVWTRDENGVAMAFNGTSAYINCGNDPSLDITDAITIEAWVKFNTYDQAKTIVCRVHAVHNGYYFLTRANHRLELVTYKSAGSTAQSTVTNAFVTDVWQHLVVIKNGSNAKIYVNNIDKTGTPVSLNNPDSTTRNLYIGCYDNTGLNFNGTIDEVRIYALALTAEQIKRRYEQTKRDYVRGS